ncbi:MAG: 16S rRNA (uracil(1498)-N(3))-methyltransferase [Propionibacteriaceae bacterium]|nr:16S rRNA (uracil(1498)-N(3))-methyltransferase [Propionibacteriaceae bacterium]
MSDGFFLADLPERLVLGSTVELTGPEAHHAGVVRRLQPGEVATVADGAGRGVRGPVQQVAPGSVRLSVAEILLDQVARPPITVVQALPKQDRAELAVDLMTEVGVDVIVPWQAARSVVRWSGPRADKALERWRSSARQASKQARRLTVPTVAELASTAQVVELVARAGQAVVCHEAAQQPISQLRPAPDSPLVCVIGPEGGLGPDELATLAQAGGVVVSLGPTVLRTSTAGAVAVAALRLLTELGR